MVFNKKNLKGEKMKSCKKIIVILVALTLTTLCYAYEIDSYGGKVEVVEKIPLDETIAFFRGSEFPAYPNGHINVIWTKDEKSYGMWVDSGTKFGKEIKKIKEDTFFRIDSKTGLPKK